MFASVLTPQDYQGKRSLLAHRSPGLRSLTADAAAQGTRPRHAHSRHPRAHHAEWQALCAAA